MRPPECHICNEPFDSPSGGELVTFEPTEEDKNEIQRMEDLDLVGHPPHMEWFCKKHASQIKSFTHLHLYDAMKKMK